MSGLPGMLRGGLFTPYWRVALRSVGRGLGGSERRRRAIG